MPAPAPGQFDRYATQYDEALARGISVSGEAREYFARGRVQWLARRLAQLNFAPRTVLDFGCGIGSAIPFLDQALRPEAILGVDVSARSLEVAAQQGWSKAGFQTLANYQPRANFDLAFCNGVFHHIPLAERASAARCVYDSLRPGGIFAIWENNPWNPGARLVMSRIPFDRDAIMLNAIEARRLLRGPGFEILRTDFLFIFPALLRWMRWLEPPLARFPFGAQYQVLARKPLVE